MAFQLTKQQQEIVGQIEGPILVKAGPGSGKTRVLTERIINLLSINKKRVLALTFSNKAAEEIKERIDKTLKETAEDQVYVGTIHGFCLDVVTSRGNLIGLPAGMVVFESDADKITILKKVLLVSPQLKQQLNTVWNNEDILKKCMSAIATYKQAFISPDILMDSNDETKVLIGTIYEAYNNMMLSQRALDFDDILYYAYKLFTERPQLAQTYTRLYKYIFVDEAQDLNSAQYKVIKAMCNGFSNIMMVGDPAQSIYGFNGSESDYMIKNFVEDFQPTPYELTENFRSTKKIIEAASNLQPDNRSSAVFPLEGELQSLPFEDEEAEAQWIVEKIEDLFANGSKWIEGQIAYEQFAIIARNRYVFAKLCEKFTNRGIPFNNANGARNVESESTLMKIFETGMRVIMNSSDEIHFDKILNLLKHKNIDMVKETGVNYLEVLIEPNVHIIDNSSIKHLYLIRNAWQALNSNVESFSKTLNVISSTINASIDVNDDEKYLIQKDIDMWKDHWNKYCTQSITGQRSLAQFRNQVSLGMTQTHNKVGISLLTVHMSKGLEFDVVFIIGLNEGTFPDYRATSSKELKEEKNNMFVALTRARRVCYLTYPLHKVMPWGETKAQQPSRYIKMI